MNAKHTLPCTEAGEIIWDKALIERHALSGPRYTSYPTAPQFQKDFQESQILEALARSNRKGNNLSLYFHIPFCNTICYYCACNKIVTGDRSRAEIYLNKLYREIELKSAYLDKKRKVSQLHWGGGTPTYLNAQQICELMAVTRQHFNLVEEDKGEFSIEVHPGNIEDDLLKVLREQGFNRLSMGVQDFDPRTQKAVNRFNSFEQVEALTTQARDLKFHSVSMDLIYGLPFQTPQSMLQTLEKIVALSPDRISLFNYAHLPHLFKTQKQIDDNTLPSSEEKLEMFQQAIAYLCEADYLFIGMDHFAKQSDDLAVVQARGELKRNFQGYSTHGDCDLIAFGVSGISAIDNIYVQNCKQLDTYYAAIDSQHFPAESGISLNEDDRLRQHVINQLICHFKLEFTDIEKHFNIHFQHYFQAELRALKALEADGLIEISETGIKVSPQGRLLVRRVCMLFDAYLSRQPEIRYSQII